MDTKIKPENFINKTSADDVGEYREGVKRIIESEVKKALSEEIKKAQMELIEEQQKAIRQILEEHKATIRSIVQEEKTAIWEKAEALRQSIVKFGL
jgi:hypothetical protein